MSEADSGAVLITGCSSGIGKVTAKRLAEAGFTVYATARDTAKMGGLSAAGCKTLALDVTDEASMKAAVAAVEAAEGQVGVLINNAGFSQSGAVEAVPIEDVRAQFDTNVFGATRMAQLVLPGMRRAGKGRILNISSVAGKVTMPGSGIYSATRFAVEAMSDVLRFEVKGFGIDVVVIEPGPTRTNFTSNANSAMKRAGDPGPYGAYHEEIAKADAEADESSLASNPEDVAKTIEKAIRARHPKTRYKVSFVVRLLPFMRHTLGDRLWDRFARTQARPPGPE